MFHYLPVTTFFFSSSSYLFVVADFLNFLNESEKKMMIEKKRKKISVFFFFSFSDFERLVVALDLVPDLTEKKMKTFFCHFFSSASRSCFLSPRFLFFLLCWFSSFCFYFVLSPSPSFLLVFAFVVVVPRPTPRFVPCPRPPSPPQILILMLIFSNFSKFSYSSWQKFFCLIYCSSTQNFFLFLFLSPLLFSPLRRPSLSSTLTLI